MDQATSDLGIDGIGPATLVGQGGFARVYRAEQLGLGRDVAVKVLLASPADPLALDRFERECRALGAVSSHPSIVEVHGRGTTTRGEPYLVMEYRSGGSLADKLVTSGPLAPDEAAYVGVRMGDALSVAHEAGVLHRDVKPANILLSAWGEPALADFGIARIDGGHRTETGQVTASITHAAREVLAGEEPTVQSDVYSLGSTLFELLCGRTPFSRVDDESVWSLINRVMTTAAPDPMTVGVPQPLAGIVARALDHDLRRRFATAGEFRAALDAALSSGSTQSMAGGAPLDASPTVSLTMTFPSDQGAEPTVAVPEMNPVGAVGPGGAVAGIGAPDPGGPTVVPGSPPDQGSLPVIDSNTEKGQRRRWSSAIVVAVVLAAVVAGGTWALLNRPWETDVEAVALPELTVAQAQIEPLQANRRYVLTVAQVPEDATVGLVVDGGPSLPLVGAVPGWQAEIGRHRLELEVVSADGTTTRSEPVELYVSPGRPQGGYRANLASVMAQPENWSDALDLFDELVSAGHDELVISESIDGVWWQFYIDGFGEDGDSARAYCEDFGLGPEDCFAARP